MEATVLEKDGNHSGLYPDRPGASPGRTNMLYDADPGTIGNSRQDQ